VDEAANRVRQEVDADANIIVGATFDEALGDKVRVSIVASGMSRAQQQQQQSLGAESQVWIPRPLAHAARPNASNDYRRRLSEAIDDDLTEEVGADVASAEDGRRTPGEVYIQEGPPQLSSLAPATRGKNRASSAESQGLDPQRGARPVPAVGDFPPHAQREYWAKASEREHRGAPPDPPFVYQRQPESPAPKTSLLRRLAGAARGRREGGREDQLPKHSSNRTGAGEGEEQVDLPVFFGRGKR
jgi:cell division protein FtsZ